MDQTALDQLAQKYQLGKVLYSPSLDSTNSLALTWAEEGCPNLSVIVADQQTRGKGRSGRQWHTIPGSSIAMSLILTRLEKKIGPPVMVGLSAIATAEALQEFTTDPVSIKWPNDVLINGKKVAGILVESQWEQDIIRSIVLGIGININSESLNFTDPPRVPATYLEAHTRSPVARSEVLDILIRRIIYWRELSDPSTLITNWNDRLAFKGQEIVATRNDTDHLSGKLVGISQSGSLKILRQDDTIIEYDANEVREISSLPTRNQYGKEQ